MGTIDLTSIRNALAAQITAKTGLRAEAQARDQISPPVAVILPGQPFVTFGVTMEYMGSQPSVTLNFAVLLVISDAPPVEKTQRALDAYLGLGPGETSSVHDAVLADPTLAGTVEFCEVMNVSSYGRVEYAGQGYFGSRLNLQCGAR